MRGRGRVAAACRAIEWPAAVAAAATALALGAVGHAGYRGLGWSDLDAGLVLDLTYHSLRLFALEFDTLPGRDVPPALEAARFLAPLVAVGAAVKALARLFADQLRQGRIRFLEDHVVIAGGGRKGSALAAAFHARGDRVVVIDHEAPAGAADRDVPWILVEGDATNPATLRRAGVGRAACLIAACGDDGTNAGIATTAAAVAGARERPLVCVVHVADHRLGRLLDPRWPAVDGGAVRLEFFSTFDQGARALLEAHPPFPGEDPGGRAHVLVAGMGRFGESVVARTVQRWRRRTRDAGGQLSVTVVDRVANRKRDALCARWPRLPEVCSIRAVDLDVEDPAFERGDFLEGLEPVTIAFVCFDDEALALSVALTLRRLLLSPAPIVARMEHEAGLATLLDGGGLRGGDLAGIHAFGLIDRTCTPELTLHGRVEALARSLHERYLNERERAGQTPATNPSLVPWEALPEPLRQSNRDQATGMGGLL
ncbi:MAG TPA: NAD-binding protein, partial [Gemmatimonadota bacterium]|nr:NAD-binding protein [Gemmatimonadota bacterium]